MSRFSIPCRFCDRLATCFYVSAGLGREARCDDHPAKFEEIPMFVRKVDEDEYVVHEVLIS